MHAGEVDLTRLREQRRSRGTATAYPTRGGAALAPEPAPATGRRSEPRLKVAPPAPVAVPRTPFVVLVLLVVVGGVVGILLLNTKVNENVFILHDLREDQAALDQRQQELEQEIARADTPARLEQAARELGLVKAEELAYLLLPGGEVVREPMPAAGLPSPSGPNGLGDGAGNDAVDGTADGTADDAAGGDAAEGDAAEGTEG